MSDGEEAALLNFFQEPVFLLTSTGTILRANSAAARLFGEDLAGALLSRIVASSSDDLRAWLRRCSGTTAPLVGSLALRTVEGDMRFRVYGARLADRADPVRIALRCVPARTGEFSLLARKVQELNTENRRRRHAQAILEEALANNDTLLRELHHRVKNNIQVMHGLLSAELRETRSDEVRSILGRATRRLLAMGAAHDLLHRSRQLRSIPADDFVRTLCDSLGEAFGPHVRIEVAADEGLLSNEAAFPLALIVNELLTNAFKHGLGGGPGTIRVALERAGRDFVLAVQDEGSGFTLGKAGRRWSGLGLVRGLCRQIGGQLSAEGGEGGRVEVRFSDDVDDAGGQSR